MFGRQRIATLVAEFLGTAALTLLVLTVQRSTIGVPFFVASAAGLIVIMMSFALGGTSGAHFNPAITLGLWTARKVETLVAVLFIAAQMLGGWGAYYLYKYFVNNPLQPIGGHFTGRIMVAEAVGTALFAFGFAAALYQGFTRAVTSSFSGLAYMLGILAASSASIGLLNPALALGARAWVWGTYVLGPVVGAIIGVNLYALLFAEPAAAVARVSAPAAAAKKRPAAKRKAATRRKR
jgi:aquaporin Z